MKKAGPKPNRKLHPKQSPVLAYTFKDAGGMSGIRPAKLREWLLAGKIKRGADGSFNVKELMELSCQEEGEPPIKGGVKRSAQAQKAYNKYWTAKAEEKELDVAVKQGKLVELEIVRQDLIERETIFKNRLLGLADVLASRLVGCGPQEIKAVVTDHVMSMLRDLARKGSEAYQKRWAEKIGGSQQ